MAIRPMKESLIHFVAQVPLLTQSEKVREYWMTFWAESHGFHA
jgi:hypothetical protein